MKLNVFIALFCIAGGVISLFKKEDNHLWVAALCALTAALCLFAEAVWNVFLKPQRKSRSLFQNKDFEDSQPFSVLSETPPTGVDERARISLKAPVSLVEDIQRQAAGLNCTPARLAETYLMIAAYSADCQAEARRRLR